MYSYNAGKRGFVVTFSTRLTVVLDDKDLFQANLFFDSGAEYS